MSDGRKRLSGSEYKKRAKEKLLKKKDILDKTPQINQLFAAIEQSKSQTDNAICVNSKDGSETNIKSSESTEQVMCYFVIYDLKQYHVD